jgi:hypothetical protein
LAPLATSSSAQTNKASWEMSRAKGEDRRSASLAVAPARPATINDRFGNWKMGKRRGIESAQPRSALRVTLSCAAARR